jgi:predicted RNA binding protein YcfA (HicA-like mRNA interferase family)
MKIPRDLHADELLKLIRKVYGYQFVRQTGSHLRIRTELNGEHFLTIPNHSPIKIGTLNQILIDIAEHFNLSKEEVMRTLFL